MVKKSSLIGVVANRIMLFSTPLSKYIVAITSDGIAKRFDTEYSDMFLVSDKLAEMNYQDMISVDGDEAIKMINENNLACISSRRRTIIPEEFINLEKDDIDNIQKFLDSESGMKVLIRAVFEHYAKTKIVGIGVDLSANVHAWYSEFDEMPMIKTRQLFTNILLTPNISNSDNDDLLAEIRSTLDMIDKNAEEENRNDTVRLKTVKHDDIKK